jgi:hypothetical protein
MLLGAHARELIARGRGVFEELIVPALRRVNRSDNAIETAQELAVSPSTAAVLSASPSTSCQHVGAGQQLARTRRP